jgi:outer membrane autotransporter protein
MDLIDTERWGVLHARSMPIAVITVLALGLVAPNQARSAESLTPPQENAGIAIREVYNGLLALGRPLTSDEQELFNELEPIVHNDNELNGSGPTRNSLGLDEEGLAFTYQWNAHEETATVERMATDLRDGQMSSIGARLSAIRAGASGFAIAGFGLTDSVGPLGGMAGDEEPEVLQGPLGGFLNVAYGEGDRDGSAREDAFDFESWSVTGGLDYRVRDFLVVGAALTYSDLNSTFDSSKSVVDGGVEGTSWSGAIYGVLDRPGYFVQGALFYSSVDYDIERRISYPSNNPNVPGVNELARSSPDGNQWGGSVSGGIQRSWGAIEGGLVARLDYIDIEVGNYREVGAQAFNLEVDDQHQTSLVSGLGANISYSMSTSFGIVRPQGGIEWNHEYRNNSNDISARYLSDPNQVLFSIPTDDPDRDYFTYVLGASAVFPHDLQAFLQYEGVLGLNRISYEVLTAGIRMQF